MEEKMDPKYDQMITKMLEARENHARVQNEDYSHVFRKKSFLDILRLSSLAIGIGFVYAAEQAFVSPTLLQIGVDHSTMTMVWGLSPALGLLLGPLIGSISDRCRLNMGRRRPIILLLSLGIIVGFFLLPFGRNIGQLLGDDPLVAIPLLHDNITENTTEYAAIMTLSPEYKPNLKIALILTILGTMLLDFNAETCQGPGRAYMLDVCIPKDHGEALSSFSVMAGLGSTFGYAIGGIDWESTAIGRFFGGNIQAVFMIDAFFFVICFLITVFSFREIPLPLIEKDKLLQPLTAVAIENETSKNSSYNKRDHFCSETVSLIVNEKDCLKIPACYASSLNIHKDDSEFETVSLQKYLKSIIVMPKSMWILSLTNLLCWMGHVCYCLYFTDFVGEAVFHGDPASPVGSEKYKLYEAGVRFGGWGMALYALSCSVYSFIIERLMVWFKPKYVYVFGIMVFAIGMYILAAWPNKLGVLIISIAAGIVYATIYTVPYIIVANYHAKSCFKVRNGENVPLKEPRGLGTDIAIINSMLFIAQIVMSLSVGHLASWMGTTSAIFYASSGLSLCAAVSATFILYI